VPEDQMPGWFPGSWAYHGDDGCLFVGTFWGNAPTSDFGEAGEFHVNDVVGVGLNLVTGEGFCTLNGQRQDVGEYFSLIISLSGFRPAC
jgi:Ran-binding protein 9/10